MTKPKYPKLRYMFISIGVAIVYDNYF